MDRKQAALRADERLALRAGLRTRLERARAAVSRALLETKAHERAGYSNSRDYAREELGTSLRTMQDEAQLDRILCAHPLFEQAVSSGEMTASRVLEVAPMLTVENEPAWFRLARTHTVHQLRKLVAAAREESAQRLVSAHSTSAVASTLPSDEEDMILKQRAPMRSRLLWEAFLEESARAAGGPISHAKALEMLLADFWGLVPPAVAESARGRSKTPASSVVLEEDDEGEWTMVERPARANPAGQAAAH